MVLVHGFTDTWRSWDLIRPLLEREHDVLAVTLSGHAGGPAIEGPVTGETLAAGVEAAMDDAGFETAHIVGNSLGGFAALQLAVRGRAESVVALAPAGGWKAGDQNYLGAMDYFRMVRELLRAAAPHADSIAATAQGRRRATQMLTVNFEHIPPDLIAHQIRGAAGCDRGMELFEYAQREGWELDAARVTCPVRMVWGTEDRILRLPGAAVRFREEWVPQAEWLEMEGVGHCPHLDVPADTAELILGFTSL